MRRWLGIGAVLAVLVAVLGYVFGPKREGAALDANGSGARAEGDASTRPLPVSALLEAPLPSARGSLFIRGTVVGLDGRPVAGAVVVATAPIADETLSELPSPCEDEREKKLPQSDCDKGIHQLVERVTERQGEAAPHARTTSDAQGRFSLEGLAAGTYALWAEGSFGTVLRENVPAGSEGLELRPGPGTVLSGRVQDEDGNAVAGALVTALRTEPSRFFDTLSDARGHWRLGPLPMGDYHLVVTHAGFLPEHDLVHKARGSVESWWVTIYRPLRLTGQVLRGGRPVAGARVQATGEQLARNTSTDAQGRFTLEDLRPSNYQVSATHADQGATRSVLLEPGTDTEDVLLELGTGARVRGMVRDPAGHPIADALVEADVSQYPVDKNLENKARTAPDGTYTLGPIPPGKYPLKVTARRYVTSYSERTQVEGLTPLDFTLDPASLIEGRVLDPAGQPLLGVEVSLEEEDTSERLSSWVGATLSGKDGTFELEAPKPLGYRLLARHADFLLTTQTVQAPSSGVAVVMRSGAWMEVEVVDGQEAPVPGARVLLEPEEEPHHGSSDEETKQPLTDERGRITLRGLEPGRYRLSVYSETEEEARTLTRSIEVTGTEPMRMRLQLQRSARLAVSGLVVDDTGKPVPEAHIELESVKLEDPAQWPWFQKESLKGTDTGADGHFQLRGLPAGRYLLTANAEGHLFEAEANGHESWGRRGLQVQAGTTDLRIVLTKLGRLRGRVVRPDGSPITRFQINGEQHVDPQGAFDLPMSDGTPRKLVFTAPGLSPVKREVEVEKGVELELGDVVLTPGREVRGLVVDAATGAPVAGVEVGVGDEQEDPTRPLMLTTPAVHTAHDGTFTLTHLEERPLTLEAQHPDYEPVRLLLPARQTEVKVALDAGATLRGKVHLSNGNLESVIAWSATGTLRKEARLSGNDFEIRGLPADTYLVQAEVRGPDKQRSNMAPRQVELPAHGVGVLDFEERRAGATLRLRLNEDTPGAIVRLVLVAGRFPVPKSQHELWRLGELSFQPEEKQGVTTFHLLPEGPYTLFIMTLMGRQIWLYREELELPGQGEVSRNISPWGEPSAVLEDWRIQ